MSPKLELTLAIAAVVLGLLGLLNQETWPVSAFALLVGGSVLLDRWEKWRWPGGGK